MIQPCPGRCNSWWRALTEAQQAASERQPCPGDPIWCLTDQALRRRMLPEIDDLAAVYECQVTGFHEQGQSPSRGGSTPSPSEVADYLQLLDTTFTDWEDGYRDWYNRTHPERPWLTRPYRGTLITVRHGTVCWLATNLSGPAGIMGGAFPGAVPFGEEVAQWHRELVARTRAGDGRRLGLTPCPNINCGLRLLAWQDGYDGLICGGCGRYVTRAEYDGDVTRELERAG